MATQLPELVGAGVYNVHNGALIGDDDRPVPQTAAQLALRPPRFCAACGRKMAVQIRPNGWWAKCSRHGQVDSAELAAR
ncbi:hypothetical protein KV112_02010 [Mycolicibacter sp. MYC123]|uniref:Biotin synthase auxiliary protein n=2 Tax=Mycolicibacter TaxID=1073531 RepID=A0ABU5YIC8_9MYCO|nr:MULTISPECIES: hypothetical protein [unclassified Mycolicibacter]MEB3048518.1 hypothetical protein [Mycolicibacter sp. MYC123]MEB3064935.1 hypothetical protein [Mycolicibacter sp. MYC101]MEB3068392.1 hypothetical protein [Mycolicibacter sp. MYC017]